MHSILQDQKKKDMAREGGAACAKTALKAVFCFTLLHLTVTL